MKISLEGLSLIKKFEGCKLEAYYCSGGVLTIGYGHTGKVKETDVITQDEADRLLKGDILKFEQYVSDNVIVELNEGDYKSVPFEMRRWNKAGGKTLDGLIRRRQAESLLFESKEWHEI